VLKPCSRKSKVLCASTAAHAWRVSNHLQSSEIFYACCSQTDVLDTSEEPAASIINYPEDGIARSSETMTSLPDNIASRPRR